MYAFDYKSSILTPKTGGVQKTKKILNINSTKLAWFPPQYKKHMY